MAGAIIRIELNRAGITELLKSDPVQFELATRAGWIQEALPTDDGAEFEASAWVGKDRTGGRAMAMVKTANTEARLAQAKDNVLIRALDAGRG